MGCACAKERLEETAEPRRSMIPSRSTVPTSKTHIQRSQTTRRRSALVTNTQSIEPIPHLQDPLELLYDIDGDVVPHRFVQAMHKKLGQKCCIKTIPKLGGKELMIQKEKLLMDVERMAKLDHPNILKTYSVAQDDHHFYIVTEAFRPIDLSDARLRSEAFLAPLFLQVFWALNYCHQRDTIHGKLSLNNLVWLDSENTQNPKVKLAGFGEMDDITVPESVFQAPESPEEFSAKADIWSCGVLLYTLLSSQLPFSEPRRGSRFALAFPSEAWGQCSQEAVALVAAMLEVNPKARPSALQCRNHAWLARFVKPHSLKSTSNSKALFTLRKLHHINPFQYQISKFVLTRVLRDQELEPLEEAFSALDRDFDGVLAAKEILQNFLRVMPESDAIASAKSVLEGGYHSENGHMTYSEFLVALLGEKRLLCGSNLRTVFSCFERGATKTVSLYELRGFFARANPQLDTQWRRLMLQVGSPSEDLVSYGTFSAMLSNSSFA